MRQKLQDLVSDCMWVMGKNGKTMKVSKFLVEMTGWVGGDISLEEEVASLVELFWMFSVHKPAKPPVWEGGRGMRGPIRGWASEETVYFMFFEGQSSLSIILLTSSSLFPLLKTRSAKAQSSFLSVTDTLPC